MKKNFCDICGEEIIDKYDDNQWGFEVTFKHDYSYVFYHIGLESKISKREKKYILCEKHFKELYVVLENKEHKKSVFDVYKKRFEKLEEREKNIREEIKEEVEKEVGRKLREYFIKIKKWW